LGLSEDEAIWRGVATATPELCNTAKNTRKYLKMPILYNENLLIKKFFDELRKKGQT